MRQSVFSALNVLRTVRNMRCEFQFEQTHYDFTFQRKKDMVEQIKKNGYNVSKILVDLEGGRYMPQTIQRLIEQYVAEIKKIYGSHLRQIILYGSYARGDFRPDSDIDIMILLDMSDLELKAYSQKLSYMTYDFNLDNNLDIKPIVKSEAHFRKWIINYPFYANIYKEGVILYGAA